MSVESLLNEKRYRAALQSIDGIGSGRLRQLIAMYGSAEEAWYNMGSLNKIMQKENPWIHQIIVKSKGVEPLQIEERLINKGIHTIIPEEENYPALLRELSDAPPLLYYKGQLHPRKEALAIVGARRATPYGKAAAESISKEVAHEGIVVVSGLARGIDTSAHKGALVGKGITWGVLGCGLDTIYPPENQKLAQEIIESGGAIISEFTPQITPLPQFFPMRNRLISGMSRGVIVVEAALKSGALITVDFALEQGREVFAVPGPIFSEQSKGSNNLLRQGAKLIEGIDDILIEIPSLKSSDSIRLKNKSENRPVNAPNTKEDSPEQEGFLQLFSDLPIHIDYITMNSKLPPEHIPLLLLELQLSGRIEQLPGQLYVLAHKC